MHGLSDAVSREIAVYGYIYIQKLIHERNFKSCFLYLYIGVYSIPTYSHYTGSYYPKYMNTILSRVSYFIYIQACTASQHILTILGVIIQEMRLLIITNLVNGKNLHMLIFDSSRVSCYTQYEILLTISIFRFCHLLIREMYSVTCISIILVFIFNLYMLL